MCAPDLGAVQWFGVRASCLPLAASPARRDVWRWKPLRAERPGGVEVCSGREAGVKLEVDQSIRHGPQGPSEVFVPTCGGDEGRLRQTRLPARGHHALAGFGWPVRRAGMGRGPGPLVLVMVARWLIALAKWLTTLALSRGMVPEIPGRRESPRRGKLGGSRSSGRIKAGGPGYCRRVTFSGPRDPILMTLPVPGSSTSCCSSRQGRRRHRVGAGSGRAGRSVRSQAHDPRRPAQSRPVFAPGASSGVETTPRGRRDRSASRRGRRTSLRVGPAPKQPIHLRLTLELLSQLATRQVPRLLIVVTAGDVLCEHRRCPRLALGWHRVSRQFFGLTRLPPACSLVTYTTRSVDGNSTVVPAAAVGGL
jgi:hypothetical protein